MFYTKLGRVVAGIALVLGVLGIALGFSMSPTVEAEIDLSVVKLASQMINYGFYSFFFAIGLGILTEISQSVANGDKGESK